MADRFEYGHIVVVSLGITIISVLLNCYFDYGEHREFKSVEIWLVENKLAIYTDLMKKNGFTRVQKVSQMTSLDIGRIVQMSDSESRNESFHTAVMKLNKKLRFQYWLLNNMLDGFQDMLSEYSVNSLEDLIEQMHLVINDHRLKFANHAFTSLQRDKKYIKDYPVEYTSLLGSFLFYIWSWIATIARLIVLIAIGMAILVISFLGVLLNSLSNQFPSLRSAWSRMFSNARPTVNVPTNIPISTGTSWFSRFFTGNYSTRSTTSTSGNQNSWYSRLFGDYFDAKKCTVSWNLSEKDSVVGKEAILTVNFFRNNGSIHKASSLESLRVEVIVLNSMVDNTIVYEEEENVVTIHFTPIKSGYYSVNVLANGKTIGKTPKTTSRDFKPGSVDPFKSSLVIPSSLMVFEQNVGELLTLDERDKYGNKCKVDFQELHKYQFVICKSKTGDRITPEISFNCEDDAQITAYITITEPGAYKADILYNDDMFTNNVVLLVLSSDEMAEVNKNISATHWNLWYDAYIFNPVVDNSEQTKSPEDASRRESVTDGKRKKVYCYISPKFLIVKEYWLKIFPKKMFTFRINPTVKISLLNEEAKLGCEGFTLESTSGKSVNLFCPKRNILIATFVKLLLKNIGGSECFEDKRAYFYSEVKKLYPLKAAMRSSIKVKRADVVDDTWNAVKSLSPGDWWKEFNITFIGEMGLDYGGLSREWIQVLVNELFHEKLFMRFDADNLQALIHPNHFREGKYKKLKYYELAGLIAGKCLIECSLGPNRQKYIKARFTRSFLSQLLGLGVSWKHFETDDKEYYTGKIKYIIENDPEYLDIYFTEDIYDNNNQLIKTVELKSNGAKILVVESNKFEYIQRLADYKLVESVKDEIGAFQKGLYTLIPDGLLTIFDENELELLLCGMDVISVSDFKANHIQDYTNLFSSKIIGWFWTVVSGFSQEELSRLLQFTTGCSQLPPGGFAGLQPKFKITHAGAYDSLPMAHTCFNQLCLPSYSSMDKMRSQFLLAINEGVEGFGFL